MAAIGSVSYGATVDYYTGGMQREYTSYYTGAAHHGEPPGTWSGRGAEKLGLVGEVDPKAMERFYSRGLDPRDITGRTTYGPRPRAYKSVEQIVAERLAAEPDALPERVRQIEAEAARSQRQSNSFADFTFSLSKDITVQHVAAGWAEEQAIRAGRTEQAAHYGHVREVLERAGHAGNAAALEYLTERAGYSRTGRHGAGSTGTWIEAKDWTVATFFQHTSRALDPQLHWHNPIALNTECADGKIRKLDTALIQANKQGAAAVGARVTQEIITRELGWTFRERDDGNGYELTNVDQNVKDLFSERSKGISAAIRPAIDAFTEQYGREPNALELTRVRQRASLETRQGKPAKAETRVQQQDRWDRELRAELGAGLSRQAVAAGRVGPAPLPETFSPSAVMARAVARCQQTQSTWGASELTRAMEAELPPYLGLADPRDAPRLIEGLVDKALSGPLVQQITGAATVESLPAAFVLDNGLSAYQRPGAARYASVDHVAAEYALQRAAVVRGRLAVSAAEADRWLGQNADIGLKADQQAAVRGMLTSGAALSALVGPAGAGKSFTLGVAAQAWSDLTGGRLIGLATSEQATEVLRGENITAKNFSQWLAAQRRIADGTASAADREWAVRPNDIIVPDEASMADRDKLTEIHRYVDAAGARLQLAGDPRQLSAVGQGGAMALLVGTEGAEVYELVEVRRFNHAWEGPASLGVRAGEVKVLDTYDAHGRIVDGGTAEEAMATAARMYVGDRLAGKRPVVVTPTNAMAAQVSGMVRDGLVDAGRVSADGVLLERDGNLAGVGDIVRCRQNNWAPHLRLRNQGQYLVLGHGEDGSMKVREIGTDREVNIPAAYRREWVELGYAGTVHSVQGGTYDTGIPVVDQAQPLESLYPAMTRGRERNTAVVITQTQYADPQTSSTHQRDRRDAQAVLADIMERENEGAKAALTMAREDAERSQSLRTVSDMYETSMRELVRERTRGLLDKLAAEGVLTADTRELLAADQGTEQLGRLLRSVEQAGHDPAEALRTAVASRSLDTARSPAQVLYVRVSDAYKGQLAPRLELADQPPSDAPADYREHFEELADLMRERRMELGAAAAQEQPAWAVETLGPVPDGVVERADWEDRAGRIAAHREATGWSDEVEPLGPPPGLSKTEERVAWHSAWEAAGRPMSTSEEHELSEGALRIRVRAMQRENATLPPSVHEELKATETELTRHQQEAAIVAAQAERAIDDAERYALAEQAANLQAMAERLEAKRADLQFVADERLDRIADTTLTRELGERARHELEARSIPVDTEPDRVTAEEWLAEHEQAMRAEDPHRLVTEADIRDDEHDQQREDRAQLVDEQAAETQAKADEAVDVSADAEASEEATADTIEDDLPAGVPTDEQVEVSVAAAKAAADEALDRASAEEAMRRSEAAAQAEQEAQEAREMQAARRREEAQAQAAEEDVEMEDAM